LSAEILQTDAASRPQASCEFCVSVADIKTRVVCDASQMEIQIDGATQKFLVEDQSPDVTLTVVRDDLGEDTPGEMIFDSGALWQLYRQGEDYLFRFATPYFGPTPYKVASFNQDFTQGEIRLHRPYFMGRAVYPLEYPLDELLMLNLLARGRGAEFHSSGIVDETGAGYLFPGQSGAGKTTTARLWEATPGTQVLSDDRIILRESDGQFRMYGTPWHGEAELSAAASAPLRGIFFLRHGERNELTPLGPLETAARLFSCGFPTFYNPQGLDFTLAFYEKVATAIPCFELSFVPEQGAVEFIRQQLV
jgi:hypothetical protein